MAVPAACRIYIQQVRNHAGRVAAQAHQGTCEQRVNSEPPFLRRSLRPKQLHLGLAELEGIRQCLEGGVIPLLQELNEVLLGAPRGLRRPPPATRLVELLTKTLDGALIGLHLLPRRFVLRLPPEFLALHQLASILAQLPLHLPHQVRLKRLQLQLSALHERLRLLHSPPGLSELLRRIVQVTLCFLLPSRLQGLHLVLLCPQALLQHGQPLQQVVLLMDTVALRLSLLSHPFEFSPHHH
mmetsp:Transcript_2183/g.6030  ORF Transcript_2183/g.6030 Transcript_2183/m.6030 type:complete len:240 (+) Transcript_2183:114-833(+)